MVIILVAYHTFFMPFIAILIMRKLDLIASLNMDTHKERIIPLIATIVFYVWGFLAIKKSGYPMIFTWFMLGTVISILLAFVINVFTKISLHMIAIAGLLIYVTMLVLYTNPTINWWLPIAIIAVGLVATSRLFLKAHTPRQISLGIFVGVIAQVLALAYWFK
ncbi:MAG: hypothetical protein H6553_00970 [Chitinophagales bacterium]|nr:hypothetical protein [Chitinophagales bacterium]